MNQSAPSLAVMIMATLLATPLLGGCISEDRNALAQDSTSKKQDEARDTSSAKKADNEQEEFGTLVRAAAKGSVEAKFYVAVLRSVGEDEADWRSWTVPWLVGNPGEYPRESKLEETFTRLFTGKHVKLDPMQGHAELAELADAGHVGAKMFLWSWRAGNWHGFYPNEANESLIEDLEALAATGHMVAVHQLGLSKLHGVRSNRDPIAAFSLLKRCAEAGLVWGHEGLAHGYEEGLLGPADYEKSADWWQKAHKQTQWADYLCEAANALRKAKTKAAGVKAIALYEQAFAKKHSGAARALGCMYMDGIDAEKDLAKALPYLEYAYRNSPRFKDKMCERLAEVYGALGKTTKRIRWLEEGTKHNSADCIWILQGHYLAEGDTAKALALAKKGSELKIPELMHQWALAIRLGQDPDWPYEYFYGDGKPEQDRSRAHMAALLCEAMSLAKQLGNDSADFYADCHLLLSEIGYNCN